MKILEIQLFNLSREFLKDDKKAEQFVSLLQETVANKVAEQKQVLASEKDIADLRLDIRQSKTDIIKWLAGLFITLALLIGGLYLK